MQDIIYSLNTDDLQLVAVEELNRKLSLEEIKELIDILEKKIDWYGIVAESIDSLINERLKSN